MVKRLYFIIETLRLVVELRFVYGPKFHINRFPESKTWGASAIHHTARRCGRIKLVTAGIMQYQVINIHQRFESWLEGPRVKNFWRLDSPGTLKPSTHLTKFPKVIKFRKLHFRKFFESAQVFRKKLYLAQISAGKKTSRICISKINFRKLFQVFAGL